MGEWKQSGRLYKVPFMWMCKLYRRLVLDNFPTTGGNLDNFPSTGGINAIVSGHVETVCLLSNRKPASYVHLNLKMEDYFVQMLEALGYDIELTYVKCEG